MRHTRRYQRGGTCVPAVGVDIVHIPSCTRALADEGFLRHVFLEQEVADGATPAHLAGLFAGKEAVIKALHLPPASWLAVCITAGPDGAPVVQLLAPTRPVRAGDLSIAHHEEYAIACYVALIEEQ